LFSLPDIIGMIRARWIRRARSVARTSKMRYRYTVGKPEAENVAMQIWWHMGG